MMHAVDEPFAVTLARGCQAVGMDPLVPDAIDQPGDLEPFDTLPIDDRSWDVFLDDEELEPLPEPGDFWHVDDE